MSLIGIVGKGFSSSGSVPAGPNTPTLSVSDDGDGTATATISGSSGAATNKVFAQKLGGTSFAQEGSRTGDGTVSLALEHGRHFAYVLSELNDQDAISNQVSFFVTTASAALDEIWKAFRDQLVADSGLTALLGTTDAIYRAFPITKVTFPILTFEIQSLNPIDPASFTGIYRPFLQFNIYAIDPYQHDKVFSYLEENWSIPTDNTSEIESTNYRIPSIRWLNPIEVGPVKIVDTGERVYHRVMDCRMKVTKKN